MKSLRKKSGPARLTQGADDFESAKLGHDRVFSYPLGLIKPSPENDKLYRPINRHDPEITVLARSDSLKLFCGSLTAGGIIGRCLIDVSITLCSMILRSSTRENPTRSIGMTRHPIAR